MKILIDGPDQILYQWDKGQRLMLHGADAGTRVDFARCDQHKAVSVYAYAEGGEVFCDIPDAILMEPAHLHGYVYEIDGDRGETVREFMLPVIRRPMPEDYVAPDEVLTWHELEQRIKKIEDEGVPDEKIAQAVENYLEENPIEIDVPDTSRSAVAAVVTDGGRRAKRLMVSFMDDDCRAAVAGPDNVNSLEYLIDHKRIPYTLACAPGDMVDPEKTGRFITVDDLKRMVGKGATVSCHSWRQYNMDQFATEEAFRADLEAATALFDEWGIPVETMSYPQGRYVEEYIPTVKEFYRMGFTVADGINEIPYASYYMHRVGLFEDDANDDGTASLTDAKAWVDRLAEMESGWLIFMTHAWYAGFKPALLGDLIDYIRSDEIRSKGIEIVDIHEALDTTGNVVEAGRVKKPLAEQAHPFFVVDAAGVTHTNALHKYTRSTVELKELQVGWRTGNCYLHGEKGTVLTHETDNTRRVSVDIPVNAGEEYRLACSSKWTGAAFVVLPQIGGDPVAIWPGDANREFTVLPDHKLTIPEGGTILRVSCNLTPQPEGYKIYRVEYVGGDTPEEPSEGTPGGYYTPTVSQPDANTMRVEYTPSSTEMPTVAPVQVALPAGPRGDAGTTPHIGENGNWWIGDVDTGVKASSGSSQNVDLTGYAKEQWVQDNYQPKGEYLTEVPEGYAKTEDIPTKPEDIGAQPAGNYALKTEIPSVPVQSVNGKTGAVKLSASDVGARPDNWMPTAQEVGALPNTYTPPNQTAAQVGADPKGTAATAVSEHNVDTDAHNDLRAELKTLSDRLTAFFDSDDTTLDELSEIVTYITNNKTLIESITTSKVNVADIVNNLTTNVVNKPLSAAQGVVLKGLIDTLNTNLGNYALKTAIPTKLSQMTNDAGYLTEHQDISGLAAKFDPTVYGLPVLYLTGDTTGMTKDNPVTLSYAYGENSGSCTLKWQGSSSLAYEKKNYTIKLDTAAEIVEGWGAQKKYCLKANFIDHSHSRNVVCAKLWGQIVKSRSTIPVELADLPNGGAIDGFPIIIMLNGEFHGLYTWNIPKDAWMFGMGSGTKEAIVGADNQADDTAFKEETLLDAEGLELEYSSDTFATEQVKNSLNQLINACIDSTGADLDTTIANYLDWESAIDYFLFVVLLDGGDMTTKNYLLSTFDGTKWYFSAYDMDSVMGLSWNGKAFYGAHEGEKFDSYKDAHRVMELIYRFKTNALKARWKELRRYHLTESRICRAFENYACVIPSPVYLEDVKRWPTIPGSSVNNVAQILRWVSQRLAFVDEWVEALPEQETPVAPGGGYTNIVSSLIDTDGSIYNGTGYKDDTRLSSSGSVSGSAQAGSVTVGFIPFTATDVIRMKGAIWAGLIGDTDGHYYLHFYNASKAKIEGFTPEEWKGSYSAQMTVDYDATSGITTFDVVEGSSLATRLASVAYIRLNAKGKGADLIITKNEEIT